MGQVPMKSFDPFLNPLSACRYKRIPSSIANSIRRVKESLRVDWGLHHISILFNDTLLFPTDDINIHFQWTFRIRISPFNHLMNKMKNKKTFLLFIFLPKNPRNEKKMNGKCSSYFYVTLRFVSFVYYTWRHFYLDKNSYIYISTPNSFIPLLSNTFIRIRIFIFFIKFVVKSI